MAFFSVFSSRRCAHGHDADDAPRRAPDVHITCKHGHTHDDVGHARATSDKKKQKKKRKKNDFFSSFSLCAHGQRDTQDEQRER
jgi:hypothetical protein